MREKVTGVRGWRGDGAVLRDEGRRMRYEGGDLSMMEEG